MEILNQFGVEPVMLLAQIVNFLILAFIFKRFLYKPILKVLKDRQKKIAKGLEDAETAAKAKADAEAEKELILIKASKEAEEILDQTKKTATELKDQILEEAKTDAEKMIATAKHQADAQMETMEKRVKATSVDVSIALLEKVIEKMFTKDEKAKILQRGVKTLREAGQL